MHDVGEEGVKNSNTDLSKIGPIVVFAAFLFLLAFCSAFHSRFIHSNRFLVCTAMNREIGRSLSHKEVGPCKTNPRDGGESLTRALIFEKYFCACDRICDTVLQRRCQRAGLIFCMDNYCWDSL
jgi:hypothetical protein